MKNYLKEKNNLKKYKDNYTFKLVILFFLLHSVVSWSQNYRDSEPKKHVAYRTIDTIFLDGIDNEESWNNVEWSDGFVDIEGIKKPKFDTKIKILWNDNYFYVFAKLEEPHVWASIKKRDAVIFHNNDFEIFIDPDGDAHNYYEIELNALNTIWDLFLTRPYREGNVVLNDWTATGMKSAVKVDGTLNNASDLDTGWSIELAIPWSIFKRSYYQKNVPANKFWRINFSRVNWDFQLKNGEYERKKDENGKLLHEYNWVWSPTGKINMHMPEKWGYVYFSAKNAGELDDFIISNDEKIKWRLFELHRKQKQYYSKNKAWASKLNLIKATDFLINDKIIKPVLETHSQGYNITVYSPFSGDVLTINREGKLTIKKSN